MDTNHRVDVVPPGVSDFVRSLPCHTVTATPASTPTALIVRHALGAAQVCLVPNPLWGRSGCKN
jgi:hypothetical protein